jgi:hypothetical protein
MMTAGEVLRGAFVSLEVNEDFSEAVLLRDGSRLCFRHRVGERWVRAIEVPETSGETTFAGQVLSRIGLFRLNAKHLDVQFQDGSCWEARFGGWTQVR